MKSEFILRREPTEAAFDPSLLDCRPDEKIVAEKLEMLAKKHTRYLAGDRAEKGAILRLALKGDHPLCRNGTVEIAQGYHLFHAATEEALEGKTVGETVTVQTEQGELNATILSVSIPRVNPPSDETVRAEHIPNVGTVEEYRRYVALQLAEKKRDRNRVQIYTQRTDDLIGRGEKRYDEAERASWIGERLDADRERMRQQIPADKFENAWALNVENLRNWYSNSFDRLLLEKALGARGGLSADASEADCRAFAKHLLLDDLTFIME